MLSGLLSLNVHEALTFEGTEICLHPDIFQSSLSSSSGGGGGGGDTSSTVVGVVIPTSARHSIASAVSNSGGGTSNRGIVVGGGGGSVRGNSSLASAVSHQQQQQDEKSSIATQATTTQADNINNSNNVGGTGGATQGGFDSRILQEGDMIEIRVWDPLHQGSGDRNNQRQSSMIATPLSSASSLRKRHIPPPPPQSPQYSSNASSVAAPSLPSSALSSPETSLRGLEIESEGVVPETTNPATLATVTWGDSSTTTAKTKRQSSSHPSPTTSRAGDTGPGGGGLDVDGGATTTTTSLRSPHISPRHSPTSSPPPPHLGLGGIPELATIAASSNHAISRPPVVPRSRTSAPGMTTTEGASPALSSSVMGGRKSWGEPRKNSNNNNHSDHPSQIFSHPIPVSSTDSLVAPSSSRIVRPPASSLHPRPSGHSRDISELSTDTLMIMGGGGDSRRPSMDMAGGGSGGMKHVMGSHSEDEEDIWNELSSTHNLRLSFVMLVTEKSLKSLKSSSRTHISILRQVADLYQLSTYDMVTVHKLVGDEAKKALQAVSADFVVVTIKDQYLSRGELHFFQNSLIGSWIYEGQRLYEPTRGIHANAREIRHGGAHANSGIVTESTTIAFRSRSARIFWLVQMSAEMWDFASPFQAGQHESTCEIYFDKFVSFIYDLFQKWKQAEVTHSLTVVFFSRTFLTPTPGGFVDHGLHSQRDIYGRQYEDHCRIVLENETRTDWDSLIVRIKEAFQSYPNEVGWNLASGAGARRPSTAGQGNLLEAVNVTLNLLQYHYLDRDLHRTGNSIVIVSAGNGVFEVDKKLAMITYQRMMDNGIGSDMLSLGLPPLHIAPFFLYFNEFQEVESEIPHWIHLSFISYESEENTVALNDRGTEEPEHGVSIDEIQEPVLDIGPNGFLRSRVKPAEASSQHAEVNLETTKKTFSPRGNAAASPAAKRRLRSKKNDDRDFRDILEACRPRATGVLPHSLKALLEMYLAGEKKEKTEAAEKAATSEPKVDDTSIREWDELDFFEVNKGKSLFIRSEISSPLTKTLSPSRIDELDLHDGSPRSSSYSSQVAHPLLGTSYERLFFVQDPSTMVNGTRMQRAPSLDFDVDASVFESGSSEVDPSILESMRRHMQKHDTEKMLAAPRSPKLDGRRDIDRSTHDHLKQLHSPSRMPGSTFHSLTRGQPASFGRDALVRQSVLAQGGQMLGPLSFRHQSGTTIPATTGGIGAALASHSARDPSDSDNTDAMPRVASTGRLVGSSLMRIGATGVSPLVLPPPRTSVASRVEGPFASNTGSRLVRPQDQSKQQPPESTRNAGTGESTRNAGTENIAGGATGLSTTPESRVARVHARSGIGGQQHDVESAKRPTSPDGRRKSSRPVTDSGGGNPSPSTDARLARNRQRHPAGGQQFMARAKTPSAHIRGMAKEPPSSLTGHKQGTTTRRRKPINPFRQQDEFEVLAQKSHNSRRWSHVFPQGEIEFKRKSGPNWKSLLAPAILPLSIDYFPPQREREHNFTFSLYNVTLSEFERNNFSSNKELLWEMVRQRITQDYQFVPSSLVDDRDVSRRIVVRREQSDQPGDLTPSNSIRMYLSIGHRLQVLHYDPTSDTVEVKTYMAKNAQGNHVGTFKYFYQSYCQETGKFVKVGQDFRQFTSPYNWNKVDRIICGDEDREMREGMRFKRIMFAILPEKFTTVESENAHAEKFKKLLEYFEKLREKEETKIPLAVKIETTFGKEREEQQQEKKHFDISKPGIAGSSMVRFYVPFRRKGAKELFEYLEVAIDSTFNTRWSYRIIFNWFVASSGKVEAQVQLLQRRCNQFGLFLVPSCEISVSKTLFLNPFKAPGIFIVRDSQKAAFLEEKLAGLDFIHDGIFPTAKDFIDCIDGGAEFDFGKKWAKFPVGRQVIHRSGVLFVRTLEDRNGKTVVVAFRNHRYLLKDSSVAGKCLHVFNQLSECMKELTD